MPKVLNVAKLEGKFASLTRSRESIQGLSGWLMHHSEFHEEIVNQWVISLSKDCRALEMFYVANDVIQNCGKKKVPQYREAFSKVLEKVAFFPKVKLIKNDVCRMMKIWVERQIYDEEFFKKVEIILNSKDSESSSEEEDVSEAEVIAQHKKENLFNKLRKLIALESNLKNMSEMLQYADEPELPCLDDLIVRSECQSMLRKCDTYCKLLEDYLVLVSEGCALKKKVLKELEHSSIFYTAQNRDVKEVANAFRVFGKRVRALEKRLLEKRDSLKSSVKKKSPCFSDDNASQSPSGYSSPISPYGSDDDDDIVDKSSPKPYQGPGNEEIRNFELCSESITKSNSELDEISPTFRNQDVQNTVAESSASFIHELKKSDLDQILKLATVKVLEEPDQQQSKEYQGMALNNPKNSPKVFPIAEVCVSGSNKVIESGAHVTTTRNINQKHSNAKSSNKYAKTYDQRVSVSKDAKASDADSSNKSAKTNDQRLSVSKDAKDSDNMSSSKNTKTDDPKNISVDAANATQGRSFVMQASSVLETYVEKHIETAINVVECVNQALNDSMQANSTLVIPGLGFGSSSEGERKIEKPYKSVESVKDSSTQNASKADDVVLLLDKADNSQSVRSNWSYKRKIDFMLKTRGKKPCTEPDRKETLASSQESVVSLPNENVAEDNAEIDSNAESISIKGNTFNKSNTKNVTETKNKTKVDDSTELQPSKSFLSASNTDKEILLVDLESDNPTHFAANDQSFNASLSSNNLKELDEEDVLEINQGATFTNSSFSSFMSGVTTDVLKNILQIKNHVPPMDYDTSQKGADEEPRDEIQAQNNADINHKQSHTLTSSEMLSQEEPKNAPSMNSEPPSKDTTDNNAQSSTEANPINNIQNFSNVSVFERVSSPTPMETPQNSQPSLFKSQAEIPILQKPAQETVVEEQVNLQHRNALVEEKPNLLETLQNVLTFFSGRRLSKRDETIPEGERKVRSPVTLENCLKIHSFIRCANERLIDFQNIQSTQTFNPLLPTDFSNVSEAPVEVKTANAQDNFEVMDMECDSEDE